jgi:hypothetical protein
MRVTDATDKPPLARVIVPRLKMRLAPPAYRHRAHGWTWRIESIEQRLTVERERRTYGGCDRARWRAIGELSSVRRAGVQCHATRH